MNLVMNHAPGAGLIARPVDLQSSLLLLCYDYAPPSPPMVCYHRKYSVIFMYHPHDGGHSPVRRANKCVPAAHRAVQLSTDPKVHQLDLRIVGEQHVLSLDVPMNHFVSVQVCQALKQQQLS